ncbi:MAG: hypothetical protein GXX96_12760 [Planctomycetaceae bacterium]|nr:hypothetical protein [Planctomycetaceae bacterium]
MHWEAYEGGKMIGQVGSEAGTIIRDDEHDHGARITLERDAGFAPYAITCGIYGWMMHTRWFSAEEDAERAFEAMKLALDAILHRIPCADDPKFKERIKHVSDAIAQFVDQFP